MRTHRWRMQELMEALHLPDLPRRIEGYDISNTQGILSVASMVVFERRPARARRNTATSASRPWRAPTTSPPWREVITRRFTHGLQEKHEREEQGLDPGAGGRSPTCRTWC